MNDILYGQKELRPADLENKKTSAANHNAKPISELLDSFDELRRRLRRWPL